MRKQQEIGNSDILIRPFKPSDRAAIRDISCDTADGGRPMDTLFPDREFIADVLTRYYTDYEPDSIIVAENESRVIGYVLGTTNPGRHEVLTDVAVFPAAAVKTIMKGTLFHSETWHLIAIALRVSFELAFKPDKIPSEYSSHLHINILPDHRGVNVGQRLLSGFIGHLKSSGVKGVTARVRSDNASGRRFFEKAGFISLGESPIIRLRIAGKGQISFRLITYGFKIE